ncbi:putative AC transposase [Morella rubra]|uniref:Putative AC transposase n=1 Tax=Morella rubra TaxID=262757 RepID=A0A6A1ULI5_9ROSI|nr:putative AC transposase [Morella rubra]
MESMWFNYKYGVTGGISQRAELDRYLEESCIHVKGELDILSWWHSNSQNFPTLGKMARDILVIPMSISTSNYGFSPEAMTINPAFDVHDPDIMEALICGADWLEKPKSK